MKALISATYDRNTGEMISAEYADIPINVIAEFMNPHTQELAELCARAS